MANAILVADGKGILNIEEKDLEEYNIKLSEYYLSGDNRKMLKFYMIMRLKEFKQIRKQKQKIRESYRQIK